MRFAREGEFTFAGEDLNQRVLRRRVFGQFLAFSKTKQHRAGIGCAQQCPADNAIRSEVRFSFEREDFFPLRVNQRFLIHTANIAQRGRLGFDLRQTKISFSAVFVLARWNEVFRGRAPGTNPYRRKRFRGRVGRENPPYPSWTKVAYAVRSG